jgi:hypothetical protein
VPSFTRCDAGVSARCFAFGATGGGANGADRVVLVDCAAAVVCREDSGGVPGATAVTVSSVVAEALVVVVVMVVVWVVVAIEVVVVGALVAVAVVVPGVAVVAVAPEQSGSCP